MDSQNISSILQLLQDKNKLLCELQRCSDDGLRDNTIAEAVAQRAEIISSIDKIDKAVEKQIVGSDRECRLVRKALKNSCNRNDLSTALSPIFDAAQQNFIVLNRIKTLSDEMMRRMTIDHDAVKKNLKKNNQKPKIAKYFPNEKIGTLRERG